MGRGGRWRGGGERKEGREKEERRNTGKVYVGRCCTHCFCRSYFAQPDAGFLHRDQACKLTSFFLHPANEQRLE